MTAPPDCSDPVASRTGRSGRLPFGCGSSACHWRVRRVSCLEGLLK